MASTLSLQLPSSVSMTDDQFFEFCFLNQPLRIERDRHGVISIMSPVGSESGNRELGILGQLWVWAEQNGQGLAFSSSTGFKLSTGADRSPDAAWVTNDRWNALTQTEREKFAPLCPDFVLELRSPSDSLSALRDKMREYQTEPGFQLGLLIDRSARQIYRYLPDNSETILSQTNAIDCSPQLPGLILNLAKIW